MGGATQLIGQGLGSRPDHLATHWEAPAHRERDALTAERIAGLRRVAAVPDLTDHIPGLHGIAYTRILL